MKPIPFASLVFLALTRCVFAAEADKPAGPFRAGAAISNITPLLGVPLIGGFSPRASTHIHDDLHVRCLVLDDGETKLVFAIVDNVQIPREVYDAAKALIHDATEMPKEHILMAATHTHSAPSLRGKSYTVLNEPLDDYQRFVIQRIADGVRRAMNNLQPARIAWGTGKVPQHVFNRRWLLKNGWTVTSPFGDEDIAVMNPGRYASQLLKPAGPVNPKVYFVSIESTDGRPIALLANYWLHYVGGVERGHVSADYFGVFSQRIGQLLAGSKSRKTSDGPEVPHSHESGDHSAPPFVGILSNGASGDVNNNDYANYGKQRRYARYEKMREVAEDVAQEVVRVRKTIKHHDWVKLGAAQAEVTLKYRRPTSLQLQRAREILDSSQPDSRESIFARRLIDAADWPETTKAIVQSFRIGDLGIAALPFEVFTETGVEIEKRSPFKDTFTIELANGGLGYLPTPRQHKLGGYETWPTVNRVEKSASPKLADKLLELFQTLERQKD